MSIETDKSSGLAVAALVLGVVGFLGSFIIIGIFAVIVSAILGHAALRNIRKSGGTLRGAGIARLGLALAYTGIFVSLTAAVLLTAYIMIQRERYGPTPEQKAIAKSLKGQSAEAVTAQVMRLLDQGKQSDAEELLENLPVSLRDDLRLTFLSGVLERSRWSKSGAAYFFEHVREINPNSREGIAARLVMSIDEGAYVERNMQDLFKLMEKYPDDMIITWLYAMSCREYYKRNRTTRYSAAGCAAYERLDKYWDVGPVLFHQTYGNILCELDRDGEALIYYKRAAELEPARWTYDTLGDTLRNLNRYDEAIEAYRLASELDPSDGRIIRHWGYTLEKQGKFKEAAEKYEAGAALGDGWSWANLGRFSEKGQGAPKDYSRARECYEKAFELGCTRAGIDLADLYCEGLGVEPDRAKAEELYLAAARLGDDASLTRLGLMYERGTAGPKDAQKAVEYYEKAADAGSSAGAYNAALMHLNGRGIKKNQMKALQLFLKAAALNPDDPDPAACVAECYLKGWGTERDMTKAIEWLEKGIPSNKEYCVLELGRCYDQGIGVERDVGRAAEIYRKAADRGLVSARNSIAWLRATTSASEYLDGKEAVKYALKLPANKDYYIDTLAAAYARDGQFEKAVETEKAALALLEKNNEARWKKNPALREEDSKGYVARISLYESGQPYTEE